MAEAAEETMSLEAVVARIATLGAAGDFAAARLALAAGWQLYPGAVGLMIEAAKLASASADPQAAALWAQAQRLHPAHGPVWLAHAQTLRRAGDIRAALAVLGLSEQHAPRYIWCWFERLDLAFSSLDDALCYAVWRGLRRALPEEGIALQRGWAVRLLRRQHEPEAVRALLDMLLDEQFADGHDLPALWDLARPVHTPALHGWQDAGFSKRLLENLAPLLSEGRPHAAMHAAIFRLPFAPDELLRQAWTLLAAGRTLLLGCLREYNEDVGRPLIGSLTYLAVAAPARLPATALLALLRLALAECPDGADALLRCLRRTFGAAAPLEEITPEGALATLCARLRTRDEAPPSSPALRSRPRLRIALCVSGQLRGYRHAYPTWRGFGLADHDVVTVVHAWRGIGRRQLEAPGFIAGRLFPPVLDAAYARAWAELGGRERLIARYPELNALFAEHAQASEAALREFYDTPHVVLEDDTAPAFAGLTNQEKMFYKISAAQSLAASLGEFDLAIRLRPDKELRHHGVPDWHEIAAQSARQREIYNDSGAHYVVSGLGMGDQLAFGAAPLMAEYAALWPARDAPKPFGAPRAVEAHSSILHHLYGRGIRVRVWPGLWGGRLFDAERLPEAELTAALRRDISTRMPDALDELFLSACRELEGSA